MSVCVCLFVYLYMSLFEARHVRLFIYAFVCHSFSPSHVLVFTCVCVCVSVGRCLQPWLKHLFNCRRQRRVYFFLLYLVVVAVSFALSLCLSLSRSATLIYHCLQFRQIVLVFERVASNSVARPLQLKREKSLH